MTSYVAASDLASLESYRQESPFDYPTPSASSDAERSVKDSPTKKKRKAWGQPVPEIVPILPPRKRAKTAEEKEQRKNERILRNRRAADKSRQRQKAAQSELEQQNKDLIAENAQLKLLLSQHGLLSDFKFSPPAPVCKEEEEEEEEEDDEDSNVHSQTPQPVFTQSTPLMESQQPSTCVAPELDISQISLPSPDLTQYPAVVLCDLQCQSVLMEKLRRLEATSLVNTVLTLIHYLITAMTSSASTHWSLQFQYQILEWVFSTISSQSQLEAIVLNNFQLLHILISMPSTPTQPAVFRLKLLSRLLACNPSLAPLLMTAADRNLQQKLNEEDISANADSRWAWASLMTMKWSIQWLSNEHQNIRMQIRAGNADKDYWAKMESIGVEMKAVKHYQRLFDGVDRVPKLKVVTCSRAPTSPPCDLGSTCAELIMTE